jgi:two-component system CheB/CheR fusion protein
VEGEVLGHLAVYYTEERPFIIPEEQNLVNGVAEAVGTWLEHKQAEEALRESEEKYRRIVETATEGIVMVDANARVVFANDRWSEIFGYSLEEAGHMTHFDMVFPEDRAQMAERWESRKRGVKENYEFRFRRKDGRPIWALIGVAPMFDPEGGFLGTLVMAADITERKQAEEALRELNATLESKAAQRTAELEHRARQLQKLTLDLSEAEDRERKRLAEILHDDLQQVLAAAKFHLGLVSSRCKNDKALQETTEQVKRLLVEAIGKSRSLSRELSPPGLAQSDLRETFEWLASQEQAKHGLTVHLDVRDEIEMQSEPIKTLLYKVAQEMLFNVIKHAQVREAWLRLRRRRGNICLAVSDKGRGFDPQGLDSSAGSGLLSIRERVNLLGGCMKVRSAKGKGSTFLIILPDVPRAQK